MTTTTEGSKVYLSPLGTDVSDYTAIETAISTADQIGCIQDLGAIASSRPIKASKCISSGEISTAVGGRETQPVTVSLKFQADDTAGQNALRGGYATNTGYTCIYELNDDPGGTESHPTYITFDMKVSAYELAFVKDDDIFYNVTYIPLTNPSFTPASVVTP